MTTLIQILYIHMLNKDASRGFLHCFYNEANCLMLNRNRNNISKPTLTSWETKAENMTVKVCLTICFEGDFPLAGLQNGDQCCECSPRRSKLPTRRPLVSWLG